MDCAMEQSLKKMAVHMYGVYNTPVTFFRVRLVTVESNIH